MIIPGVIFGLLDVGFSQWVSLSFGAIFGVIAVGWVALELALGPTANSRIRTSGANIDLPIVRRTRRAHKLLAKIDEAVRSNRALTAPPSTPVATPTPDNPAPSFLPDTPQTNEP